MVSYSPFNRVYAVGRVTGAPVYVQQDDEANRGLSLQRQVEWDSTKIPRDALNQSTKNSLGSVQALFQLPDTARDEILARLRGDATPRPSITLPPTADAATDVEEDTWAAVETQALERVKDLVARLEWDEMQNLVAGILRAMGYKTQVSPPGPDRGIDIIASPDGFGFEHPRIIVEVKHHKAKIGSQEIRSFLGGRHVDDRGLYVSTGGFTKEAFYESDRAGIPLTLWTLDHVVRTLMEYYDTTDSETKRLVPLKRVYWPA